MSITPRIIYGPYGMSPQAAEQIISLPITSDQDGHTGIGIGSWLTNEAGGAGSVGLRASISADTAFSYVVQRILLADGVTPKLDGHLTAVEAGSGNFLLAVVPIGGLSFEMEADGALTDADAAAYPYFTATITAPADTAELEKVSGPVKATANIKIGVATKSASSSGKPLYVHTCDDLGTALVASGVTNNAYTTGKERTFLVTITAAGAAVSQG